MIQPSLFVDEAARVLPAGECFTCTQCGEAKSLEEFSPNTFRARGHQSWCKPCRRVWKLRRAGADITPQVVSRLAVSTACDLCGDEVSLFVDHCHVSGVVRGLLCNRCNTGLGMFRDSPILLARAIDYLAGLLEAAS